MIATGGLFKCTVMWSLGLEHSDFERLLAQKKEEKGLLFDHEQRRMRSRNWLQSTKSCEGEIRIDFPADPWEQLKGAINAVFLRG